MADDPIGANNNKKQGDQASALEDESKFISPYVQTREAAKIMRRRYAGALRKLGKSFP